MDVRLVKPMTKQCERARECASLRLDGELSEFEQALLVAHLARCEPCRSFANELESTTNHMRLTPLERLGQPVLVYAGSRRNIKITTPHDLRWAELLLATTVEKA